MEYTRLDYFVDTIPMIISECELEIENNIEDFSFIEIKAHFAAKTEWWLMRELYANNIVEDFVDAFESEAFRELANYIGYLNYDYYFINTNLQIPEYMHKQMTEELIEEMQKVAFNNSLFISHSVFYELEQMYHGDVKPELKNGGTHCYLYLPDENCTLQFRATDIRREL